MSEEILPEIWKLWVYLETSPLLGLTMTLLAYLFGLWLFQRSGQHPLVNPVAVAILVLVVFLSLTGTDYPRYFEGAQFIHFLLGPATVALAVPLYGHAARVLQRLLPIMAGLLAGCLTAILSTVAISWLLGGSEETILSLAPRSVTTPVAMGISESIGGLPSLTAVLVILTGISGAVMGPTVLRWLHADEEATGLAMGIASHGIGVVRAFQLGERQGAFAGLAMGLSALLTAVLVPLLLGWWY